MQRQRGENYFFLVIQTTVFIVMDCTLGKVGSFTGNTNLIEPSLRHLASKRK